MIKFGVYEVNGKEIVAVNSVDLAILLGKVHANVVQEIKKLISLNHSNTSMFIRSSFLTDRGNEYPSFLITMEGLKLYINSRQYSSILTNEYIIDGGNV